MRCFSWNVNGIRAVEKKGALQDFVKDCSPDIILFQEIKAQVEKLGEELLSPKGYTAFYHSAVKPGYSGVGVWIKDIYKSEPIKGMPKWDDTEGRVLRVDILDYSFLSVYVPNGGKSEEAYRQKKLFLTSLQSYARQIKSEGKVCIIGGDLNVARTSMDLESPEKNLNHVCFREDLRKCFEEVLGDGLVDVYREYYPNKEKAYTWWSNFDFSLPRGVKPRDVNKGWRIDYFLCFESDIGKIKSIEINSQVMGSDHCPISISL